MSYWQDAAQIGAELTAQMESSSETDDLDHLPRTEQDLSKLNLRQRVLSSAAVASGCDAVGYYVPNATGGFTLNESIELYDFEHKIPTTMPATLSGFAEGTFNTADAARHTSEQKGYYHVAVRDRDGNVQAVVLFRPPAEGYNRIQSATEAQLNADWLATKPQDRTLSGLPDLHEPADTRVAKLGMASDILNSYSKTLVKDGDQPLPPGQDIGNAKERDAFLLKMAKDMFKTFPKKDQLSAAEIASIAQARTGDELRIAMRPLLKHDDAMQGAHVVGTADLMKYSVDALNEGTRRRHPAVTARQESMVELLSMLHDIGKSQFTSAFFQDWNLKADTLSNEQKAEQKHRSDELFKANANHAYLDNVVFSLFPNSAKIVADHHHGHDRYSTAEVDKTLGKQADHYIVATNHVPPEQVHTLSRMLRVADVTEAITGRSATTLANAMRSLANKCATLGTKKDTENFADAVALMQQNKALRFAIKDMDPNSIDRDALCFMIEHGVFTQYGAQRDRDERAAGNDKGWSDDKGNPKYNAAEVQHVGEEILTLLHWEERKKELTVGTDGTTRTREENLREAVHDDPVFSAPSGGKKRSERTL